MVISSDIGDHSRRWIQKSGSMRKRAEASTRYDELHELASSRADLAAHREAIEVALLRGLWQRQEFVYSKKGTSGSLVQPLRRILTAVTHRNPQTLGFEGVMVCVAGQLLLLMEEEDAFWVTCCVIEDVLPGFYDATRRQPRLTIELLAFQRTVLQVMPHVDDKLTQLGLAIQHFVADWWLTLFTSVLDEPSTIAAWDALFLGDSLTPARIALGLLTALEPRILLCTTGWSALELLKSKFQARLQSLQSLFERSTHMSVPFSIRSHKALLDQIAQDITWTAPNAVKMVASVLGCANSDEVSWVAELHALLVQNDTYVPARMVIAALALFCVGSRSDRIHALWACVCDTDTPSNRPRNIGGSGIDAVGVAMRLCGLSPELKQPAWDAECAAAQAPGPHKLFFQAERIPIFGLCMDLAGSARSFETNLECLFLAYCRDGWTMREDELTCLLRNVEASCMKDFVSHQTLKTREKRWQTTAKLILKVTGRGLTWKAFREMLWSSTMLAVALRMLHRMGMPADTVDLGSPCVCKAVIVERSTRVRNNTMMRGTFTVYTIQVTWSPPGGPPVTWQVNKRYSNFEALCSLMSPDVPKGRIMSTDRFVGLPALPGKRLVGFMGEAFLDQRQKALSVFLQALTAQVEQYVNGEYVFVATPSTRSAENLSSQRVWQDLFVGHVKDFLLIPSPGVGNKRRSRSPSIDDSGRSMELGV